MDAVSSAIEADWLGACRRAVEGMSEVLAEAPVVRAKIVAPVADAMRLIYSKERDAGVAKAFQGFRIAELLRREEDEFDFACLDALQGFLVLTGGEGGVDDGGFVEFAGLDRIRLIFLQSDQRGHDDGRSGEQAACDLVDGRFSRSGGLNEERVAPFEEALNGLALAGPEGFKPEKLLGCGRDINWFSVPGRHIDDEYLDASNTTLMC